MIELRMLEGSQAGRSWTARHFPVRLGRAPGCDVVIEEPGVWEHHVELDFAPASGFVARALSEGSVLVNGLPPGAVPLKNGSTLRIGAALLQFWLASAPARRFRLLEAGLWTGLAALVATEVFLLLHFSR